jgi:hypothetical protein
VAADRGGGCDGSDRPAEAVGDIDGSGAGRAEAVNTIVGVVVLGVALLAQVAPVLATVADAGQSGATVSPGAVFEAFRDALNVGVIGVVIWAIRWSVTNLGPKAIEAADRHNSLIAKLEAAIDRLEQQHQTVQRDIKELHQSCANWKPKQ